MKTKAIQIHNKLLQDQHRIHKLYKVKLETLHHTYNLDTPPPNATPEKQPTYFWGHKVNLSEPTVDDQQKQSPIILDMDNAEDLTQPWARHLDDIKYHCHYRNSVDQRKEDSYSQLKDFYKDKIHAILDDNLTLP